MRSARRAWLTTAGFLAVLATLAYMTQLSWLKWGDLVIDTGRELYVPAALTEGRVLYRDIFYVYGPFSPYFNALLYEILGVHTRTLALGGYLSLLVICGLLYRLSRTFLGAGLSLATLLCFLVLFPFGHGNVVANYNYLIPYSYPAVHSLLFSLASLLAFHRHLQSGRGRDWWVCACLLLLTLLTKVEVAVWLAISLGVGLYLHGRARFEPPGKALGAVLRGLLPPVAAATLIYRWLYGPADSQLLGANLLDSLSSNLLMPKGSLAWRLFSGSEWGENTLLFFAKAAQLTSLGAILAGGGYLFERAGRIAHPRRRRLARVGAMVGCLAAAAAVLYLFPWPSLTLHFRAVPIFCAVAIVLAVRGRWRGEREAQSTFLAALALFALLVLSRMLLNVGVGWFGFYLLVPGFLVFHILAYRVVPDLLPGVASKRFLVAGFLLLDVLVVGEHLLGYRQFFEGMTYRVHAPRGDLRSANRRQAAAFSALLKDLSAPEFQGKTLVAFPEGLAVNFFSGMDNPLYYYQYLPIDLKSPEAFRRLIEDFERKKPDYFVLLYRPVQEYGMADYLEYAGTLQQYIEAKYRILTSYDDIFFLAKRIP